MKNSKGIIFVISGPSGVGKSTLVKELLKSNPLVKKSSTYTTRSIREGEVEGIDYNFIDIEEFESKKKEGCFLETIKIFNHYYATDAKNVHEILQTGHCILVLDTTGARKIMQMPNVVSIFIQAVNLDVLRQRMHVRKSETHASLDSRILKADEQMDQAKYFDYIVTNDQLELALMQLNSIIIAQECKNRGKNDEEKRR